MRRAAALLLSLLAAQAWGGDLAAVLPGPGALSPLSRDGAVERHTPDSLWERINGEAELYRRFGLREAAFAYFEHPQEPSRGLEVSAFRMTDPLAAFGVWATFRRSDAAVEPLGNGGFRDGYQAAFWHGATFFLLHAFGDEAQRAAALEGGLAALTATLGPAPRRPGPLAGFEGLAEPDTVRFLPDHLLGREALPPGFEGTGAGGIGVFLSLSDTGDLAGYRSQLREGRAVEVPGGEGYAGIDPDLGPVTWAVRGGRVAGARALPEVPGVLRTLEALLATQKP